MDQENPYASPHFDVPAEQRPVIADLADPVGPLIARRWDLLVFERGAVFPARCIICNQPTESRLRKRLEWCHPIVFLFLLCNLIVLLIAYLVMRTTAQVDLGKCDTHLARRRRRLVWGWLAAILGIIAFFAGIIGAAIYSDEGANEAVMWGMIALLVFGLGLLIAAAWLTTNANGFQVKRIDNRYIRLRRISPEFLAQLPELDARE